MKVDFKGIFASDFNQYPFVIVDVGARGGMKKELKPLAEVMRCIAFEPEKAEYERLCAAMSSDSKTKFYDSALWNETKEIPLHITASPGLSSSHMPNEKFLKYFCKSNTAGYALKEQTTMTAKRLDEVLSEEEKRNLDFIKIDVEGCTYQVLDGGRQSLQDSLVIGLQLENEFNPKYAGQKLFSDCDLLLRDAGYQLFDIESCRWKRKPGLQTGGMPGQLIHGDFLYLMDTDSFFEKLMQLSKETAKAKISKYIVFASLYGIFDLAFELLDRATEEQFYSKEEERVIRNTLSASSTFLMRLPKLRDKGLFCQWSYYLFMALGGVFLKQQGFWKPSVQL